VAKNEKTSKEIGSLSARILPDPDVPLRYKRLAASALTQMPDRPKRRERPRWFAHMLKVDPHFLGSFRGRS
jgi:hypothetical protein